MKISIITLFPDMFQGIFNASIIKRAQEKKLVTIEFIDIRNFGIGKHKIVDDKPYGGGIGMVLRVDVLDEAISSARCKLNKKKKGASTCKETVILLDPQGETFRQAIAKDISATANHIILVCGHYEGVDERVRDLVDREISVGDYVLTGGEIPAMVIVDAVTRLIPGVIEKEEATVYESFTSEEHLLEYPQYTRPSVYKKRSVPDVLLSGNHAEIAKWRKEQSLLRTKKRRPDLLRRLG